jgi:K+-transporting ATPase KdpF subunit
MNTIFLVVAPSTSLGVDPPAGYIIGMLIGLILLGYLFYSLVDPDKYSEDRQNNNDLKL